MREKITDLLKTGTDHVRSLLSQSRVVRRIGIAVLVFVVLIVVLISGIPHYVAAAGLELVCGVPGIVTDGLTPASDNPINSRIKHLHRKGTMRPTTEKP